MFSQTTRTAVFTIAVAIAAVLFTSCSSSTVAAKAGTPEFYWQAAKDAYASGDYPATLEQLARLTDNRNDYTARAIPWEMVLTTGLAAGYIEIADSYAKGARVNPASAQAFRRKAAEYRNLANPLVLEAARSVDKLEQLPPGSITLTFGRPRGTLNPSAALYKVAAGLRITEAEANAAPIQALERNVLLSACMAVGAPNDSAKATEILSHASTITPRPAFASAMAEMLEKNSTLYARNEMDLPDKLELLQGRAKALRTMAEQVGPAMVVKVQSNQ
jgi:hypothetical protein